MEQAVEVLAQVGRASERIGHELKNLREGKKEQAEKQEARVAAAILGDREERKDKREVVLFLLSMSDHSLTEGRRSMRGSLWRIR